MQPFKTSCDWAYHDEHQSTTKLPWYKNRYLTCNNCVRYYYSRRRQVFIDAMKQFMSVMPRVKAKEQVIVLRYNMCSLCKRGKILVRWTSLFLLFKLIKAQANDMFLQMWLSCKYSNNKVIYDCRILFSTVRIQTQNHFIWDKEWLHFLVHVVQHNGSTPHTSTVRGFSQSNHDTWHIKSWLVTCFQICLKKLKSLQSEAYSLSVFPLLADQADSLGCAVAFSSK